MNLKMDASKAIVLFLLSISSALAATAPLEESSNFTPPSTNPEAIVTMGSGIIAIPTAATSSFSTNIGCPINFTPYVTVTLNNTEPPGTSELMAGNEACVETAKGPTTSNVTVTLYTNVNYVTYQNTSVGGYYGTSSGGWTVWSTESMPQTSYINATTSSGVPTGTLTWVLYCYPPTMIPPAPTCP